ncbi:MAG: nicotinate phosphoribosyltransferase [Nitrospirae bacterium]|nr:nicotinate phosphoribosyltransferase [Nitrospirota bacterium]
MQQGFVVPGNMAMLTDLYELTMAASYFEHRQNDRATFDLFVRTLPPQRSYLMFAGLEQALHYLTHLSFDDDAIRYLRSTRLFSASFLSYLRTVRFRGHVDAMPEGTVFFPQEPVMRVTGNIIESQIVETFLLNTINLQSLIATKASRVVEAAAGRPVVDFGLRRAQGMDAGLKVARAAYLAGCAGTSNVLAGQHYGIPIFGTMAHSFVQSFPSEMASFRAFVETFPTGTTLLIDTYETLQGARQAVVVARELAQRGHRLGGVRLDSGDLLALSRSVRRILDQQRLHDVQIFASGNLTEHRIAELIRRGAPIDAFGVGTDLSVSADAPSLDVVYKMSEVVRGGRRFPTLKLSPKKRTYPGRKQVHRREQHGRYIGDMLALEEERVPGRPLLRPVLRGGRLVGPLPSLSSVRAHAAAERAKLPSRLRGLGKAHSYPVRLSAGVRRAVQEFRRRLREVPSEQRDVSMP